MKKSLVLFLQLIAFASFGQTKGISYQAVIIDPNPIEIPGEDIKQQPYVTKDVWLQFAFFRNGVLQYEEVQKTKTDAYGLVNLVIGTAPGKSKSFASLVWEDSPMSLQTKVSFDQGRTFNLISEQLLNYVPYSFYSETSKQVSGVVGIENGGTGAITSAAARSNLGLGSAAEKNETYFEKPIDFAAPFIRSGNRVEMLPASANTLGYLKSTDYVAFSNKQDPLIGGSGILIANNQVSATGITSAHLAANAGIANAQLANKSITIGNTSVDLGATTAVLAGLSSVTSTTFTGNLMGNASTSTFANTAAIANTATTANQATKLATPRTINGVPFDGSSNITVVVDANYLSGNTLNANVTASNLSSVGTITAGVWSGSTIAISNGGTGATTKSAAFDALSPLNSSGDLLVGGTTGTGTRLAKGNDGSSLMVSSGIPAWKTGVSKVATATDNYTLTLADHVLVMGVSTAASKTITLPAATGNQGKEFFIKNISSYPMSLVATGTEKIMQDRLHATSSQITVGIDSTNNWVNIISDGSNWVSYFSTSAVGQSVDYVSVDNTVEQILVTGDKIKFNRVLSGNIPYNPATGNFTLTAGKTYRLTGLITLDNNSSGSNEISSVWKNANGDNLSALGLLLSVNFNINGGGQGVTDVIYTPTSNTTVSLVAQYVGGTTSKTRSNFVSANIQQIGSSAAVYPWTLAGTNTYNTIGNVGIGTTTPSAKLEVNGDVKITGKINLTDPTGNVVMKSAEIVNRGTDVTLGNLKVRFAASGNMSLQISTVAGTYSLTGSSSYVSNGLNGSSLIAGSSPLPISTTPVYLTASTNLSVAGDTCTWLLYDPAAGLGWRIFAIVGVSNANNMVTVERVL